MMTQQGYQRINSVVEILRKKLTEKDKDGLRVFLSRWENNTEGSKIILQYIQKIINAKKDKGEKINEEDKYIYAFVFIAEAFYEKYKLQLNKKNIISANIGEVKFDMTNIFSRDTIYSILYGIISHIEKMPETTQFKIRYADTDEEEKEIEVSLPKYTGVFYVLSQYIVFAAQFEYKFQIEQLIDTLYSQLNTSIQNFYSYQEAFAKMAQHATKEKYRYGQEKVYETAKQFGVHIY